ncbi:hypothetical protein EGW08_017751 [Elysia chlorotica]|uniref:Contactin n=1 Tax=Elysia chlorotica TaxID=188477 RepID=A0A3S1AX41_ELYCH|nr:hypothetical protein EGW08_017751 [Elysia chlorotica]
MCSTACPDPWSSYRGHCYRFEADSLLTYDEAKSACGLHGAGVLSVETTAEHSFLVRWLTQHDPFQRDWYTSGVRKDNSGTTESQYKWESTEKDVTLVITSLWLQPPDTRIQNGVIVYGYGPLERGPRFLVEPHSIVVVSQGEGTTLTPPLVLDCVVTAVPQASYRWLKGPDFTAEVTMSGDDRVTITNGRLTIKDPTKDRDWGVYRCVASNEYGTVISSSAEVTFGALGEFNNVKDAGTRTQAYDGATLQCSAITFKPAISYQWMKGDSLQFVRPEFQEYIFISKNGKLYFSEVTRADESTYRCIAVLAGVNSFTIGQAPSRISLPIPLIVEDQAPKSDWGPRIQNDFIAVFPSPPLRGQDVRLECFAYGSKTSPFRYRWSRDDKPLPTTAKVYDHSRVLVLANAQLEDSGVYSWRIVASTGGWLGGLVGWLLGWSVVSEVKRNVLTISMLSPALHAGMYQCAAKNTHGETVSNAQLRVLALPPSLERYPPPSSVMAARGGNLTLRCHPEGAPFPKVEWSKDGAAISNGGDKYTVLANGNLHTTHLTHREQGEYTCTATNQFGTTQAASTVRITEGATLVTTPSDDAALVNETMFLPCQASHPESLDMVYEWTFNGFPLDFRTGHYQMVRGGGAERWRDGERYMVYEWTFNGFPLDFRTGHYQMTAVAGGTTTNSTALQWVQGSTSGGSLGLHVIQAAHQFSPSDWWDHTTVRPSESVVQNGVTTGWHSVRVEGLNPGTAYRFRVLAVNEYGRGLESAASAYVRTHSAPPAVSPRNVRGGGGSIGTLTIRWDALDRSEYGTSDVSSVGYRLFWRVKVVSRAEPQWSSREIARATADHLSVFVGQAMYFTLYETKVQAFNDMGFGPNSSVVEVYSAETLPTGVPQNVNTNTYNSTAIEVFWDPVPQTREAAGGIILGYQYYGQLDYGLVIGLDVDVNMVIDVQVFNSAGLGSRSNRYIMETSGSAPLTYPQEVRIWSAGEGRAHLWWRGITITVEEEGLTGYAIWVWPANENPDTARLIELPGMVFHYTLTDLDLNTLYALRLAAVGGGGYGKKTPTIYFTVEGQIVVDSLMAETIDVLSGAQSVFLVRTLLVALAVVIATVLNMNLHWLPCVSL